MTKPRRTARYNTLYSAAFEGLQEYYPDALTAERREALSDRVLPSYRNTGDRQTDYRRLRDELETVIRYNVTTA